MSAIVFGGTSVPPFYSLAYHQDPCTADPRDPVIRPAAWDERVHDGIIQKVEKLIRLTDQRWMGQLEVDGHSFRVCMPMVRLYRQAPTGELTEIMYGQLKKGDRSGVKYIVHERTSTNVATVVTLINPLLRYPAKQVELVVPWGKGHGWEPIDRILGSVAGKNIGQKIIVTNIPDQYGMAGVASVKNAKPDGYKLLAASELITINFYARGGEVNYWDFEPVCLMTSSPIVVAGAAAGRWKSFGEVLDRVKKEPRSVRVVTGWGSMGQFFFGLIEQKLNRSLWDYGASGGSESIEAVVLDSNYIDNFRAGRIRLLAVASEQRHAAIGEVPTLREFGMDMTYALNRGLVVPYGTAMNIVDRWENACAKFVKDPSFGEVVMKQGGDVNFLDRKAYGEFLKRSDGVHLEIAVRLGFRKR